MYQKTKSQYVLAAVLGLFAMMGLLPLLLVVIASFSSQQQRAALPAGDEDGAVDDRAQQFVEVLGPVQIAHGA